MRKWVPHIHLSRDSRTGRLVRADRAEPRPGRGRYQCLDPNCRRDLTIAKSKYGRLYFRHFRDQHAEGCAFNTHKRTKSRHDAAQALLCTVLREALACRTAMPHLQFMTLYGLRTAIPILLGKSVEMEWTCPATGRRADIAVLDTEGEAVFLVEIFHSHAVDGNKRKDLGRYWWVEISADEFLDAPEILNVLASGNLPYAFEILGRQADLFEFDRYRNLLHL
jgi:hypothetical protein